MAARHRRTPRTTRRQRGIALAPLVALGAAGIFAISSPTHDGDSSAGSKPGTSAGPTVAYDQATGSAIGLSSTTDAASGGGQDGSSAAAPGSSNGAGSGPTSAGSSTGTAASADRAGGGSTPPAGMMTPPEAPGTTGPSGSRGNSGSATTTSSTSAPPGTAGPVVQRLDNVAEATAYCAQNLPGDPTQQMIEACGKKLVGATTDEAAHLLSGTLVEVLTRLGLTALIPTAPPVALPCLPIICVS